MEAHTYFDPQEFSVRASFEDRHFWHTHRREVVRQTLHRVVAGRAPRLIEFGCGIGTVATHLNKAGFAVDYSDVFEQALGIAKAQAASALGPRMEHRRFIQCDITREVFPLTEYGGVLLLDVIEHLPSAEMALLNIANALSPNAFTIVTVPAFPFLWSPWDDIQMHKRRYTKQTLARCLEQGGFQIELMTHFFGPLLLPALGVKGLRKLRERVSRPGPTPLQDMAEAKDLGPLNRVLETLLSLERPLLRSGKVLAGTSLLAVARKS